MLNKFLKKKSPYDYEVAICCIVKNENLYLNEWIEFHLKVGVSKFYIYDNESEIPVKTTLRSYIKDGIVQAEFISGTIQQFAAYEHCLKTYGNKCKWIAFIDADEYIVPKANGGNLALFLKDYKKYGGLGVNWLLFGSNGHLEKPGSNTIYAFTKRTLQTNPENDHIKSIVQPKYVSSVGRDPHHFTYVKRKFCVNENFEPIDGPKSVHTSVKIRLNHYFLRSLQEFEKKVARGRADYVVPRTINEFYELDKEANIITDENAIELLILLDSDNKSQIQPLVSN